MPAGVPVVVPAGGARYVGRHVRADVVEVTEGDQVRIGEVTVRAVHAEHDGRRWPLGPAVAALGYLLTGPARPGAAPGPSPAAPPSTGAVATLPCVYFAGDTDVYPPDGRARPAPPVDGAAAGRGLGCDAGHRPPDARRAAQALQLLQPAAALPIHWGGLRVPVVWRSRPHLFHTPGTEFAEHAAELAPDVQVLVSELGDRVALPEPRGRHPSHPGGPGQPPEGGAGALGLAAHRLALMLLAAVLPGLTVQDFPAAASTAALIGLCNALVWPVVTRLALPLTVLTLGIGPLLLNGALVLAVDWALPGITVHGLDTGLLVTVGLTPIAMLASGLSAVDDDDLFFRTLRRRWAAPAVPPTTVPGVLFLQLDGLGHDVLQRAVRGGDVPNLAAWLASGSHHLVPWQTDWSSQTAASQAGILFGSNHDLPAFRWLEKETGRMLVSNHPGSAAEIERRRSTGRGLLHADGASRGNIFTGDAADAVMTMSVAGRRRGRTGAGYYAYFAVPYNTSRTLVLAVAEVVRELVEAFLERRRRVTPRVGRTGLYPLLRAFTTVVSRDVIVATLIEDLQAGRSVVYADFVGYDEVAHHSGVERPDSLGTLRRLDRQLGRLARAAATVERPYRLVVLSDHGQSQGAPFRTRYGQSLEDVVRTAVGRAGRAAPDEVAPVPTRVRVGTGQEGWGYLGGAAQDVAAGTGLGARAVRGATRNRVDATGELMLGPDRRSAPATDQPVVVLASGNLGLVHLTAEPDRLTLERIEQLYPGLVATLVGHPGIGFVLVRTESDGDVVLGAGGSRRLGDGRVLGRDPLAPFGPGAAAVVARTSTFPHCADLMVNSMWDAETGEVAAFEEQIGSHGGLGGEQSRAFLLYPSDLSRPPSPLLGAEALHHLFRRWLAELGHEAFQSEAVQSEAVEPEG